MKIQVFTEGFVTPNGRAFLYPLLRNAHRLRNLGHQIDITTKHRDDLGDCDVLVLDSKAFTHAWGEQRDETLEQFAAWRRRCGRLAFFDLSDSAGWINGTALRAVDLYCKSQVLKDRLAYTRPLYGRRAYTDYYHREFGVIDAQPASDPQVDSLEHLDRIRVSWCSGLADYSALGPYLMALYQRVPVPFLLRKPRGFAAPKSVRPIEVSCRMGTAYHRDTVAFQRKRIRELLGKHLRTEKLGRLAYFAELAKSRVVVSPFGLGEITLKDFEVFITGGLLLKPDMSHMETWPDLYRPSETMLVHKWDLTDLEERIEQALDEPDRCTQIAETAQRSYEFHMLSDGGAEAFCDRFTRLLSD